MGYTPEWWKQNRDRVNKKRSDKYASDAEYRKAAKERAKRYRERKKKERGTDANTLEVGGKIVPAYTTAQVSAQIGVDGPRIKYMQRAGYLPPAMVSRPVRLYTAKQIQLISKLEAFLRDHQDTLRGPPTPESDTASKKLDTLTTTIKAQWET